MASCKRSLTPLARIYISVNCKKEGQRIFRFRFFRTIVYILYAKQFMEIHILTNVDQNIIIIYL